MIFNSDPSVHPEGPFEVGHPETAAQSKYTQARGVKWD